MSGGKLTAQRSHEDQSCEYILSVSNNLLPWRDGFPAVLLCRVRHKECHSVAGTQTCFRARDCRALYLLTSLVRFQHQTPDVPWH